MNRYALFLTPFFACAIATATQQPPATQPAVQPTQQPVDLSPDEQAIVGKLETWREMFSATGRGERFDIDDYPQLFLPPERGDEMLTFDQYVPAWASTQIDGVDGYRTVWNNDVNARFPNWTITKMQVLEVEISGDLAWSALNFWGDGTRDGEPYTGGQHGTHIWYDIDPGPARDWRMKHEHLTAITVQSETVARYDDTPPAPKPDDTEAEETSQLDGATFDHFYIRCRDLDRMVTWYTDVLGFAETKRFDTPDYIAAGATLVMFEKNGYQLEIVGGGNPASGRPEPMKPADTMSHTGYNHVCLRVGDMETAIEELKAKGVEVYIGPNTNPHLNRTFVHFKDPEGNDLELVEWETNQ